MLRDSFLPAARLVIAAAVTVLAAVTPRDTLAQAAAVPAARADSAFSVRWEHAELRIELDGSERTWITRDSVYGGGDMRKFARRIGAPQLAEGMYSDVRLLDHFAEQGWELMQCETRAETIGLLSGKGDVRRCLFRRPRREAPPA